MTVGSRSGVFCHSVVGVWLVCQVVCCSYLGCIYSIYCIISFTSTNHCLFCFYLWSCINFYRKSDFAYFFFIYGFFLFYFGCVQLSKSKSFGLVLSFDFFGLFSFVFRLVISFQKDKLSSFKLVLIRFGYRGFSFLSHAARLWVVVFSKLRWLVWIII